MNFDAALLARAWLSVASVSGTDKETPLLYRTVAVEEFGDGVRLVATDRYAILHAWVPAAESDLADEPELADAPLRTVVAADVHGRAKGFLAHVLGRVTADEDEDIPKQTLIGLDLDVVEPDGDEPATFEGMDRAWVVLDYPGHERLRLGTVEGEWPSWRTVDATFKPQRTGDVALSPDIVTRLAKVAKWHPGPLVWHFGGAEKAARVEFGTAVQVRGLVMPVRWGFGEDEA